MAILASNLKFRRAAVMDVGSPLNGGPPSSVEIVSGASNQIFPDLSETDLAGGMTHFAKIYPWVDTASTDTLMGANVVIAEPPANSDVSVVLFAAASVAETQADMLGRVGAVNGALPANVAAAVSTGVYMREGVVGSGYSIDGALWEHSSGATIAAPGPGAQTDPAARFTITTDIYNARTTRFAPGNVITLIAFYNGAVTQYETLTIKDWYCQPALGFGGTITMVVLFEEASAYGALWPAGSEYFTTAGAATAYGTYILSASAVASIGRFKFHGVTRLAAGAAANANTLNVESVTAGVIPTALALSPAATEILGFRPSVISKAADGREPIFEVGRRVVVGKDITLGPSVRAAGTVDLGETLLKRISIIGANGSEITAGWTADLDAGHAVITSVAGWSQPVTIIGRAEDMALVTGITGSAISIAPRLSRAYPAGASVSSALVLGNVRARLLRMFDQSSWLGTYSDAAEGSGASAEYNLAGNPMQLSNADAIAGRWRLQFTTPSAFTIHEEGLGQIGTGTTSADVAPINPATGQPYFTLPALGFGAGWSAGNVLRFDTEGAAPPCWLLRCAQAGTPDTQTQQFAVALRGGVDRP